MVSVIICSFHFLCKTAVTALLLDKATIGMKHLQVLSDIIIRLLYKETY